jgi:hypothetical protein
MPSELPIPRELWDPIPPAAQAALAVVLRDYQQRIEGGGPDAARGVRQAVKG